MMHAANAIVVHTVAVAELIILASLVMIGYYAMDREPPFAVLSVVPAQARAGEDITIEAAVRRDMHRDCDAAFSRYLHSSDGARFDLGHSIASAAMIRALDEAAPGVMRVTVRLPTSMMAGPAKLQTVLDYYCNKVHRFWPISVTTDLPFTVLPP